MKRDKGEEDLRVRAYFIALTIPPFVFLFLISDITMVLLFAALSFFSLLEFSRLFFHPLERRFFLPFCLLPLALLYGSPIGGWDNPTAQILWYACLLILIGWGITGRERVLEKVSFGIFGLFFLGLFPFLWIQAALEMGRQVVVGFILLIWISETASYLVGRRWGSHKIIPRISPGKSWEGFFSGIISSGITGGVLTVIVWRGIGVGSALTGSLFVALAAFFGDVFESALKRQMQVKDSGNLLPGHGGVLDRFDSFFLSGPVVYLISFWWGG